MFEPSVLYVGQCFGPASTAESQQLREVTADVSSAKAIIQPIG
jgi:hypothetical protein